MFKALSVLMVSWVHAYVQTQKNIYFAEYTFEHVQFLNVKYTSINLNKHKTKLKPKISA